MAHKLKKTSVFLPGITIFGLRDLVIKKLQKRP